MSDTGGTNCYTQQAELQFIDKLGTHLDWRPALSQEALEGLLRGYLESLDHRSQWWRGADIEALRRRAEGRLAGMLR